jgi:hypothetical protein
MAPFRPASVRENTGGGLGERMHDTALSTALTFGVACVSAAFFLWLRSEDKGRVTGPHTRWWAAGVIGLTGVLSTAVAFCLVYLVSMVHREVPAYVSLGIVMPSTLWLGEIRQGSPERRNPYRDALTFWLSWLLRRLDEGMVEDGEEWCRRHIVSTWTGDELIMAAHTYHDYLRERLSPSERQRYRISGLMQSVESRLDIALLVEDNPRLSNGGGRAKINAALASAKLPQQRYRRSVDDLARLALMLRSDASQDLIRMLRVAYRAGLRRLPVYQPPRRPGPPRGQRPHP